MKTYTEKEVSEATLEYFNGDYLAENVFTTKYALRDKEDNFYELTPDDMHRRLAKEFARIERNYDNPLSEEEIYEYLKRFDYIVPQGSPMYAIGNDFVLSSTSNCVVIDSPEDSMTGIFQSGLKMANLFKRRCGVGIDLSTLRYDGAGVNNAARTSSGAWSFAEYFAFIAGKVGQNGRRGAEMISMDVRHPDIENFVGMKDDLKKATGANMSVRVSDDFMRAVENKEKFMLQFPVDSDAPTYTREIDACDLWHKIAYNATYHGEPGVLMWDNITKNLPAHSYDEFRTVTTNPCGEVPLSNGDSCRLISINLRNLVDDAFTSAALFNYDRFRDVAYVATRLADDLIDLELEKIDNIIDAIDDENERQIWYTMRDICKRGRRVGIGTHGLADALAKMGIRYDSDEANDVCEDIYSILRNEVYLTSVKLADERGMFPAFDWDTEKENEYILRLPSEIRELMATHGRRNISMLTNAPTGSVSIVSRTSSGIEPVFRNGYTRRRKLSHDEADIVPDSIDENGEKWIHFDVRHHNVEEYLNTTGETEIPSFFVTSDDIDWKNRVRLQATIQKNVDHSISSTINLPKGTSEDVVAELYMLGWKLGLKGITVYVDGSREGVLISNDAAFTEREGPPRPQELECEIHRPTIKGEGWVVLVGVMDGRPYEVFAGRASKIELPKKFTRGRITKRARKTMPNLYDLYLGYDDDELVVKDIVDVFDNPNNAVMTRMMSLSLRQGAAVADIVEQLQKDTDNDFTSFSKVVARTLKKFIPNGTKVNGGKKCPSCGAENSLIHSDGCITCTACVWSKCG
jgi:ribonucleoside-diphosphate reductase alpha chain